MIFPYRNCKLVQLVFLNKVYTVSMLQTVLLSDTNIARSGNVVFKLTSLNDFPLQGGPVSPNGDFKQILDSFYVRDSPLCVINIAEMAMFYLNWTVLMIFP